MVLSGKYYQSVQAHKKEKQNFEKIISGEKASQGHLLQLMKRQWTLSAQALKEGISLRKNTGERVLLKDLLVEYDTLLLLYFEWSSCSDCQKNELQFLDTLAIKTKKIVVGNYKKPRDFFLYMKNSDTDLDHYYLENTRNLFRGSTSDGNVFTFLLAKGDDSPVVSHYATSSYPEVSELFYRTIKELENE
jgi:hypothetical protein